MTENYDIELFFSTNERCHDLQPLITVITPYYNNKNLLVTVKSVLQQDYLSIEYIIADDGSTAIDEVCTDIRKLINTEQKLNFREINIPTVI